MEYQFTTTGKIKYDPRRPKGMKRGTDWWCVVDIDKEITRYYRWWAKTRYGIILDIPSFDAHISIIRGEKPPKDKMHLWKKYDGKVVEIKYSHYLRQSGDTRPGPNDFWFVDVDVPFFTHMRDDFGFKSNWNQHITIGRLWYDIGLKCKNGDV